MNSNIPAPVQDATTGALEGDQTASTDDILSLQEPEIQMLSGAEMYF